MYLSKEINNVMNGTFDIRTVWRREDARWADECGFKVSPQTRTQVNRDFALYGKSLPCDIWNKERIASEYPNGYACIPSLPEWFKDANKIQQESYWHTFADQMEGWNEQTATVHLLNG